MALTLRDLNKALKMAKTAALKSGSHLMDHFGKEHTLLNKNGSSSGLYSKMDKESSDIIIDTLLSQWFENFPEWNVLVISEESQHPILAQRTDGGAGRTDYTDDVKDWNDLCWVIDPVCGSVAYARGIRDFIVSIALVQNHQVLLAVVYDPPHHEMFQAIHGQGAYLNGVEIHPAETLMLDEAIVSMEHQIYMDVEPEKIRQMALAVRKVRTAMTCALEMCYVACGRIDAVIKLDQAFYDYVGGALILSEALKSRKGLINIEDGERILPFSYLGSRVGFIASNGLITEKIRNILFKTPHHPWQG